MSFFLSSLTGCIVCFSGSPLSAQDPGDVLVRQLELLELHGFSGAVLVRKQGSPEIMRGLGKANNEKGIQIGPETLFPIASLTKHFTGAAFLFLEQEGKLNSGDTLGKYWKGRIPRLSQVTFEQLLRHRSGLPADCGQSPASEEEFLACLEAAELKTPDTAFEYSNAGYALLAASIEKIAGESYSNFIRRHLLLPAGMMRTGFLDETERWKEGQVAQQYTWKQNHGTEIRKPINWNYRGSADLVSNVRELGMWSDFLYGGFLKARALDHLWGFANFGEADSAGPDGKWCLAGAFTFGYSSRWCGTGNSDQVLVLSNHNFGLMSPAPIVAGLIEQLLERKKPVLDWTPQPGAIPDLESWAGSYPVSRSAGLEVSIEGSTLEISGRGQEALNWLVSRDPAQSKTMDRLTRWASDFVHALESGDFQRAGAIMGDPAGAETLQPWLEGLVARSGDLQSVSVIGTIPQGDGYRSYVEFHLSKQTELRRLRWVGDQLVSLLPGSLPFAPVRFVPVGAERLIGYHIAFPGRGPIELKLKPGKRALEIRLGGRTRQFHRVDR